MSCLIHVANAMSLGIRAITLATCELMQPSHCPFYIAAQYLPFDRAYLLPCQPVPMLTYLLQCCCYVHVLCPLLI